MWESKRKIYYYGNRRNETKIIFQEPDQLFLLTLSSLNHRYPESKNIKFNFLITFWSLGPYGYIPYREH